MPEIEKITSARNPRIKNISSLRERKARDESGLIIVEGIREITRAREARVKFREVYYCPDLIKGDEGKKLSGEIIQAKADILEVSGEIFSKIAFGERQEGLLAVCERPKINFSDIKPSGSPLFVVVERVEKPGNLGAILRSCDGAGVDAVILCDAKVDGYNPNVIRSSLGTIFSVLLVESSNEEARTFLKNQGAKIFAAIPGAKTVYTQADFQGSAAIVLGGEQKGLSGFWAKNADSALAVPMRGKADSLNVSATAAILIYEAIRQRNF